MNPRQGNKKNSGMLSLIREDMVMKLIIVEPVLAAKAASLSPKVTAIDRFHCCGNTLVNTFWTTDGH